jgi:two-component system response regulator (stage 0 sporulation protein A)
MHTRIRVMAIDNSIDVCEMLRDLVKSDPALEWVGYVEDGLLALDRIGKWKPDVILLDIIMPQLDGVAFLEQLIEMCPINKPKIIVLSAVGDQALIRSLAQLGVDYYLLKPVDASILINRIKQVVRERDSKSGETSSCIQRKPPDKDTETHVARLLFQLDVPTHFKGYLYLKDAISMIIEETGLYTPVTTTLYMEIANKHGTTPSVVEAAVRYAIQQTWKRGNLKRLKKLFGAFSDLDEDRMPTNSLFMTRVAEEIKVSLADSRKHYVYKETI